MKDLDPTTLADAGMKIASALGLQWPNDRAEIVLAVNMAREEIYNRYKEFRLFDSIERCFCLQQFRSPCSSGDCCDPCGPSGVWQGITLPYDMVSVASAWQDNTPMKLNSRWRESVVGLEPKPRHEIQLIMQGGGFVTERDFHNPSRLNFTIHDWRDDGKSLFVEGLGLQWEKVSTKVTLGLGGAETPNIYREITNISFLDQRYGPVTLAVGNPDELQEISRYAASENVPSYNRYRVNKLPCTHNQILIQGLKRYVDIYFDEEVVEIGSRLFLDSMGRWYRYRGSRDKDEVKIGAIGLTEALRHIDGIIARHRGNNKEDDLVTGTHFARQQRQKMLLPGYTRKPWRKF